MPSCRESAVRDLEGPLAAEAAAVADAFTIVDACIDVFSDLLPNSDFAWACGLALAKGRHLATGCHALILEGLGQEAGALLRPLVESIESLWYFRESPVRIQDALQGRHPSAGEVAKRIQGKLHPVRKYLNESASHLAFTVESLKHLYNQDTSGLRCEQVHDRDTLARNIKDFFYVVLSLASEGVLCVAAAGSGDAPDLADRVEACRKTGAALFREA